ncbi:unnamed protein product [Ectocarpus fasciculatus]
MACSQTHEWRTFEGGLQRVAFAFTLGAAAIVMSAILWTLSVPWVAWCLLRMAHPADDEGAKTPQDVKDDGNHGRGQVNEEEEVNEKVHPGYFRRLVITVLWSAVLVGATVLAAILCALYIFLSVILWFVGLHMIYKWVRKNWTKNTDDIPGALAGQEDGEHWQRAWELVSLRNHGIREDFDQAHFNVLPFLKSKTGLDRQHLTWLTKAQDTKSKCEKELTDVDRELPGARIDLDYLRNKGAPKIEMRPDQGTSQAAGGNNGGEAKEGGSGDGAASSAENGGAGGGGGDVSDATTAAAVAGGAHGGATPACAGAPASTPFHSIAASAESGGPTVDDTSKAATLDVDEATGSGGTDDHDPPRHVKIDSDAPACDSTLGRDTKMGPVRLTDVAAGVTTDSNRGIGDNGDEGHAPANVANDAQSTAAVDVAAGSADGNGDGTRDHDDGVYSEEEIGQLEELLQCLLDKQRRKKGKEDRSRPGR